MAKEKKITVKHFDNKKVKQENGKPPLYLRLRYNNIQAEVQSFVSQFNQQYQCVGETIDDYGYFDNTETIDQIKNIKSLKEEEKEKVELVIRYHVENHDLIILKLKPRYVLEYYLTSLYYIIDSYGGYALTESFKDNKALFKIVNGTPIIRISEGLGQMCNEEFRENHLIKFQWVIEIIKAFKKSNLNGKVFRAIDWIDNSDYVLKEIGTSLKDEKISFINNCVQYHINEMSLIRGEYVNNKFIIMK